MPDPRYQVGCDVCQALSGSSALVGEHVPGWSAAGAFAFVSDHHDCGDGHWSHLRLVPAVFAAGERPVDEWWPRPLLGPPLPGEAQRVVCPNCQAVGGDTPGSQSRVVWKRTDTGEPFCYCRACGMAWGPGAEADYQRARLRGLTRPSPGGILPS